MKFRLPADGSGIQKDSFLFFSRLFATVCPDEPGGDDDESCGTKKAKTLTLPLNLYPSIPANALLLLYVCTSRLPVEAVGRSLINAYL